MNNYCGFIEVWGSNGNTVQTEVKEFKLLARELNKTIAYRNLYTVAIFKIKLDGGYNKTKN